MNIIFTCIPPVVSPVIVKAGSRRGSTHGNRILIVVAEFPVMFTEPGMYEFNDLQNPVHIVLPSVMTNLVFLPIVHTPQDLASHIC